MKTFLTVAAALVAVASASAVSAQDPARFGSEWKATPSFGPRSAPIAPVHVRAKDRASALANCDCPMMKANPANCMMDMRGNRAAPSKG